MRIEQIRERLTDSIELTEYGLFTFLNPYSYLKLRKSEISLDQFEKIFVDGQMLCFIFRLFRIVNIQRRSFDMTSMAPLVFHNAEKTKKKVYLIGSKADEIKKATKFILKEWPELNIVGNRSGYFHGNERELALKEIIDIKPDLVIVGMGALIQEQFLIDLNKGGWEGVGYTCGGFFHQTSSTGIVYYPPSFDKLNLRWLYRIYKEPKLIKRYTIDYVHFLIIFMWDIFVI